MPDIVLTAARKSYPGAAQDAVRSLDLTIRDGEFMCLLGPSGCGKTTTLRMIAGLENLSGGKLSIDGAAVDCVAEGVFVPPEQRKLGLVFQSYALWPHLSVERNVDFGLLLRKVSKADREKRVTEVMVALGIDAYRARYPSQLSGGQQQRVALARMLAVSPGVLLLDEPLSNLDARLRLEMRAELKRIHAAFGTTIVFVTHDQWEAMTLATTIAVMNDGAVQQIGAPDDIYERPANRFVAEFVGSPPINIIEMSGPLGQPTRAYLGRAFDNVAGVASVGIRPEALRLTATDGEYTLPVTITAVLPTGGSWIIEVRTETQTFFLTTHLPPRLTDGAAAQMTLPREALHLFDAQGQRIETRQITEIPAQIRRIKA